MTTYDLKATTPLPPVKNASKARWVFGPFLLIVTLVTVLEVATDFLRGRWTMTYIIALTLFLIINAMFLLIFLGTSSQAMSIGVDENGIRLHYPKRGEHVISWNDPHLKIHMRQTEGAPDKLSRGLPMIVLFGFRPFQTYLTREAFEGIMAQARERKLGIRESPGSRPGWMQVLITPAKPPKDAED